MEGLLGEQSMQSIKEYTEAFDEYEKQFKLKFDVNDAETSLGKPIKIIKLKSK